MERKSKQRTIHFDGKFDSEIRKLIKRKRLQLGLPYRCIAELFSANWSTVRKWETGPTETCSVALRPKLEDFLNGKYDKILLEQQKNPLTGSYPQCLPECALRCMEKFAHTYQLLRFRPELRENMLADMDKVTYDSLQRMITPNSQDAKKE